MDNELKEQHDEATAPKSEADIVNDLSLNPSDEALSEATRPVLVMVLAKHGINHDTLNISRSAFSKLSKPELIKALKNKRELTEKKQSEGIKSQPQPAFDVIGAITEVKDEALKAIDTGEYRKLDSTIASRVLDAMNPENGGSGVPFDSGLVSKAVIGLGVVYFGARLVGFDTIGRKFNSLTGKAPQPKAEDEQRND